MPWNEYLRSEHAGIESGAGQVIRSVRENQTAWMHVPDSTGISQSFEVTAASGFVVLLQPDKDTYPGAGATIIRVLIGAGATMETTPSNAGPWVRLTPVLTSAVRRLIIPYPGIYHFNMSTAQGAGQLGLLRVDGISLS